MNTTGAQNTAAGYCSLKNNTTGNYNSAHGQDSLQANTTASHNTACGWAALYTNTTGATNTAVGYQALYSNTTASDNTAIGKGSLYGTTTGTQNVAIGTQAGGDNVTGDNCITLGHNAQSSSNSADNEVTLGNSSISNLRCADTSISSLSDARDKTDVVDLPVGLEFINTLRPVKFKWQTREGVPSKDGTIRAGFLAQDLQSSQNDSESDYLDLVMDNNPDKLEAKYGKLIPVLVKALQEATTEINTLKARVSALEAA